MKKVTPDDEDAGMRLIGLARRLDEWVEGLLTVTSVEIDKREGGVERLGSLKAAMRFLLELPALLLWAVSSTLPPLIAAMLTFLNVVFAILVLAVLMIYGLISGRLKIGSPGGKDDEPGEP